MFLTVAITLFVYVLQFAQLVSKLLIYSASPIPIQVLVVCNPYKWLPIYEEKVMKQYIHQARIDVAPHIFATAESAYRNMITEEENQCVIISGESGAGKTEASKQIQSYIAQVSGGGQGVEKIKTIFLESNPVLEAFGNAKTLRNNNSSRFGKYFELKFNRFGIPEGGVVTNYLLEKSRICSPGHGERNFHIFYQLIKSDFSSKLLLSNPESMKTLSCSDCYLVDGLNDKTEFDVTLHALRTVGWGNTQIQSLLSLVAAVMHLGNVTFKSKQVEGVEGSAIANKTSLECFCSLTKTDYKTVERALLVRELQTMAAGGVVESYAVPQSPTQAATRRDAVCKSLYERMFNLIVERINAALAAAGADQPEDGGLSIGVLVSFCLHLCMCLSASTAASRSDYFFVHTCT
jgi:myosin I